MNQRDRRNLTPDQLALVMGRHYNRAKKRPDQIAFPKGNRFASPDHQKVEVVHESTADRLAKDYGVSDLTIQRNGKFAAAVDTLRAVDPDIEQRVVTGKGPTCRLPRRPGQMASASRPRKRDTILLDTRN